jgi:hypothetical protein
MYHNLIGLHGTALLFFLLSLPSMPGSINSYRNIFANAIFLMGSIAKNRNGLLPKSQFSRSVRVRVLWLSPFFAVRLVMILAVSKVHRMCSLDSSIKFSASENIKSIACPTYQLHESNGYGENHFIVTKHLIIAKRLQRWSAQLQADENVASSLFTFICLRVSFTDRDETIISLTYTHLCRPVDATSFI